MVFSILSTMSSLILDSSTSTAKSLGLCRSILRLKCKTENGLHGPKLPIQRAYQDIKRIGPGNRGIVRSASYPYPSGPWPRQQYTYSTATSPPFDQQEETENNRPLGDVWKTAKNSANFIVTALTRFGLRMMPEGTSKQTVETGVKGGLILLLLVFARSIISLMIALGSIGVLIFVGSKILNTKTKSDLTPHTDDGQRAGYQRRYYQPSYYYPPGPVYPTPPGVYEAVDATVIDPWTADVLTVWREPVQPQMITPSFQYQRMSYLRRIGYQQPTNETM